MTSLKKNVYGKSVREIVQRILIETILNKDESSIGAVKVCVINV